MWDWDFTLSIMPNLLRGLLVTIQVTMLGMSLAVVIGLPLALGRRSDSRLLRGLAGGIVQFVRCTPLLVQLYFVYYAMPRLGLTLPAFSAGVLTIGLHIGCYIAEVYRAGIEAVPRGQWEAATALNLPVWRVWTGVVLPQAIPPMIPAIGNYLLGMFKESAQLSAITVVELLQTAKNIGIFWFRFLEPMTLVGVLYLLLCYPSALLMRRLEARFGRIE